MDARAQDSQRTADDDALWYKDAVIYELHVKAFFDGNNDGNGDFAGLIGKLDYLEELGVTAVWLLPFYPSPLRDDGYDIADYRNIHPDYGTRAEFRQFVREAHKRGLRVITELVVNHTSDQHPWFQAARHATPGSSKRDYYVWSESNRRYSGTRVIFSDTETSNWSWDNTARAYYWHRFFSHQPDLNFDNPNVLKAIIRVMRFWLDCDVDGMRLDAIPYLCEREGTNNENLPETHALVRQIRAVIDAHYHGRMLLAEANQWPEDVRDYFGAGDECHMAYHFPLMPRIYMAIAQEERHPIVEIMEQTPDIPENCQWAIFLRNHDELTLEMVTNRERDYMYQMYAADPRARINLGIRRRLAPLMDNDPERIKLMNALLLSMPGSPIIYYGDEIGMGDNIYLGDRNGVRTPMQWSSDRNAGFSRADPQRLYLPPIMDPIYGFEAVNVEAQSRDSSSLLNWMRRVLAVRKSHHAFGRGTLVFLRPANRKILAYVREYGGETLLCVANLARSAQPVELDLKRYGGLVPVELLGNTVFPQIGEMPYLLTLHGHGFYWFRLAASSELPAWRDERMVREDMRLLVLFDGWRSFFVDRVVPWRVSMAERLRATFEREVLPPFVASRRWCAGREQAPQRVALEDYAEWHVEGQGSWLLALCRFEPSPSEGPPACFMPLALHWEGDDSAADSERQRAVAAATLARVRHQARMGVLVDAGADESFCRALHDAIAARIELRCAGGVIRCTRGNLFAQLSGENPGQLPVAPDNVKAGLTTVTFGQRLFFKIYRCLQPGVAPEAEIGRFLTERVQFNNTPAFAGCIDYVATDGTTTTLALLQAYVENQGDGWRYTLDYLHRVFDVCRTEGAAPDPDTAHGGYLALMRTLGQRTAQWHLALATASGDPAFDPEPTQSADVAAWSQRLHEAATAALQRLEEGRDSLPDAMRADADALLRQRQRLYAWLEADAAVSPGPIKIRIHGDYRLGRVLLASNDFVIFTPGGDSALPCAARRRKDWPLADIAGMLRSFDHAAQAALAEVSADATVAAQIEAAAAWRVRAEGAFLGGYREVVRGTALDADDMKRRLTLVLCEKLLRELDEGLARAPQPGRLPLREILARLAGSGAEL